MFKKKYLTIVHVEQTIGIQALLKHINIKSVRILPLDLLMYEFYDELYEIIYSANQDDVRRIGTDEKLRANVLQVKNQERNILDPLYKYETETKKVVEYWLSTPNYRYSFPTLGKRKFIYHEVIKNYSDLQKTRYSIYFSDFLVDEHNKLNAFIEEWLGWAYSEKELLSHTITKRQDGIDIQGVYSNTFEDSAAVLFGMLNELPFKTKIVKVSF